MSKIFIINEWLWYDLNGDNSIQNQNAAADAIKREIARMYFGFIRINPKKYKEVNIEGKEDVSLEGINPDDLYLVRTYYRTKAPLL